MLGIEAEYPDWPSSGKILLQIFELRTEIKFFLNQESGHQLLLLNTNWLFYRLGDVFKWIKPKITRQNSAYMQNLATIRSETTAIWVINNIKLLHTHLMLSKWDLHSHMNLHEYIFQLKPIQFQHIKYKISHFNHF